MVGTPFKRGFDMLFRQMNAVGDPDCLPAMN